MTSAEELLKPVSAEEPCGPDLAYDPAFQQLETLVRGKPETQFSAAEDPDWKEVRDLASDFHGKSKHLTAAVILTLSLLKTEGFAGFRNGLAIVQGLLEQYWDTVYPRLDPDDNNDPTERLNILANLVSHGDPYRLIPRLQETVICQSPSLGRVKLNDIIIAKQPPPTEEGKPAPLTEAQIQATFKDSNVDGLKAVHDAVVQSLETLKAMDALLSEKVGAGRGTNFDELNKSLKQIQSSIAPFIGVAPVEGGEGEIGQGVAGAPGAAGARAVSVPGAISSREDVVQTLERICQFYQQTEPSSPVPYILRRAQRIAKMNYMEIVNELTPDAMSTVKVVTGPEPGEGQA